MTAIIDTPSPADIQAFTRAILDGIRFPGNEPPPGCEPPGHGEPASGKGHIIALATIGATAMALAHINGDTNLRRFAEDVTEDLSMREMEKFQSIIAMAEIGLLDAYAARRSAASTDNSGNTSP